MSEKLVTVELLEPLRSATGVVWAAGERAGFLSTEVDDLLRRGLAKRVTRPPEHKMVDGGRTQTK